MPACQFINRRRSHLFLRNHNKSWIVLEGQENVLDFEASIIRLKEKTSQRLRIYQPLG